MQQDLYYDHDGVIYQPKRAHCKTSSKAAISQLGSQKLPHLDSPEIISRFRSYGIQPSVLNPFNKKPNLQPVVSIIPIPDSVLHPVAQYVSYAPVSSPIASPRKFCPTPTSASKSIEHFENYSSGSKTNTNLTQSQIKTFVDTHNLYRQSVNPSAKYMPEIQWSEGLAKLAQAKASKCKWKATTQNAKMHPLGENLFLTSDRSPNTNLVDPTIALDNWGAEKQYFDKQTGMCQGGFCDHYKQMVWTRADANSVNPAKIGCAISDCPKINYPGVYNGVPNVGIDQGTMIVCQYSPAGNYFDYWPYLFN